MEGTPVVQPSLSVISSFSNLDRLFSSHVLFLPRPGEKRPVRLRLAIEIE